MAKKRKQFQAMPEIGTEKCPLAPSIYHSHGSVLFLPGLKSTLKSAVKQYFVSVEPRVVYSTNELLSAINKDVLSALQKSNVIYQFS